MTTSPLRIKICGITRRTDALAAAAAGADAVGLVFYAGSPRHVSMHTAQDIVAALPPFVSAVGLFVNADATEITHTLQHVPLDVLQFHGDEDAAFCRRFHRPYIKAVRVRHADDIQAALRDYPDARALLFDAYHEDAYGGTGLCFDWNMLPESLNRPWVLAGGLTPENVAHAISLSGANAVDVSGGVEAAKGIKDSAKITAFIRAARHAPS
ncbi:MAG: phosphoribosylanthranilate isomerase [Neisseria sp.]|nr:phosphoribosylanthranilate isomerase [Neisseria sp.]